MKLGIIGLPGAGKATIFEALTRIQADDGSHRGENRIGTIRVPDERIDFLSKLYKPKKTSYAQVEYLLPAARAFQKEQKKEEPAWTEIRNCDALIHVLRNFGGYGLSDPVPQDDFSALDQEMIFQDLLVVEKRLERLGLDKKRGREINEEELRLLKECRQMFEQEVPLRRNRELAVAPELRGYAFVSAKPTLVVFNNDDDNESAPEAGDIQEQESCQVIRGRLEHELAQMSEEDAKEFLEEFGVNDSAMDRIITASYELLGLISFFTVGEDEVRAWTIRKSTSAVDAAEVIHSDIKKGFIRAEVVAYNDLVAAGSRKEARKVGTVRLEGKTYQVHNGDIIEFRFNV